jgi:hypothetical protein
VNKESTVELETRLRRELPMYAEAKRIHARMMAAGDDGSWAGETNPTRVMIYATAILAEELAIQSLAAKDMLAMMRQQKSGFLADPGMGGLGAKHPEEARRLMANLLDWFIHEYGPRIEGTTVPQESGSKEPSR